MNFEELMTKEFGDVKLRYVGSILGNCDPDDPWEGTGDELYDGLVQMFGEDQLEEDPVLDIHPAYTGKKGWYIQSGDIWFRGSGEECVFEVIEGELK
jgi:hypothetical protein